MGKPLISIGLLTYNHEKYISDVLESLLSQDYECIELIILDDASTDNTLQTIYRYMKRLKNKFVRVADISNQINCGNIPHNCNRMIMEMKGDFYFEFSGDDILLPDGISKLYKELQKHKECMIVYSNIVFVPDTFLLGDSFDINDVFIKDKKSRVEPDNLFQQLMAHNINITAPTVLFRKEVFDKYGYHDETIAFEDYEYWLRVSQKEKIFFLDKPTVLYRRAESSITNFSEKDCFKLRTAIESDFLARKKYVKKLKRYEQVESWKVYFNYYIQLCTQHHYQEGIQWLEDRKKEIGIEEEGLTDYKIKFIKCCKEIEILKKWIKIKNFNNVLGNYLKARGIFSVAIYGYSFLGVLLHKELINDGIYVSYIIDRKGRLLECPLPVYTLDDVLPLTNSIIVAPVDLYDDIGDLLRQKIDIEILDLGEIMDEVNKLYTEDSITL